MNARKVGWLLTILAGTAAISMTAAQAAGTPASAKPVPTKSVTPTSTVIVKLGDAMLEEYHGGNPARRTTSLRGGDVAQKSKTTAKGKPQS